MITLETLLVPDQLVELRAVRKRPAAPLIFFSRDTDDLNCKAEEFDARADVQAVYFTLNPIRSDIPTNQSTRDEDITHLVKLPLDVDPIRETHTASTASEMQMALDLRDQVVEWTMHEYDFPKPTLISSGNGAQALWNIDFDPDRAETLHRFGLSLDQAFSTDLVKIDTTVYNPSRIWKCPGTTPKKGPNTPERPWREAVITQVGE